MKDKLKNKILEGEKESIRLILSENLQVNSDELKGLIRLSKNKGIKIIQAILINRIPNALKFYTEKEQKDLIVEVISELSEDIYAAGWYDKIEYDLWNWIKNDCTIPKYINHRVIENDLKELKLLSENLNLWGIWESGDSPKSIDLQNWKEKIK